MSQNMNKEYTFVEKKDSEFYSLKIVHGPYTGVIYTYGAVTVQEDIENDVARLSFKYRIEDAPAPLSKDELESNSEFNDYIGDILSQILEDQTGQIGNAGYTDDNTKVTND